MSIFNFLTTMPIDRNLQDVVKKVQENMHEYKTYLSSVFTTK